MELLDPNLTQRLSSGQMTEPLWRRRSDKSREEVMAILAYLLNPGGTLGSRARQALVKGPPFVDLRLMRQSTAPAAIAVLPGRGIQVETDPSHKSC